MSRPAGFEEELRRLEEIVETLEQEDVPLEKSLELFEEGVRLARSAQKKLAQAELQIKQLVKDLEGEFTLKDLEPGPETE